jgi:multiple sugar transport system substrate-binding protein
MDPEVKQISPLISIVDEMARFGILQMWPRPPVPEIADIIAITGEEMHDMLLGATSIDDALTNSQNRVDALMRAHGHY